jgi:hypothetical protein
MFKKSLLWGFHISRAIPKIPIIVNFKRIGAFVEWRVS